MIDAAELTQAFTIKFHVAACFTRSGTQEALFLIVQHGPGIDACQFCDDVEGIADIRLPVINGEILVM